MEPRWLDDTEMRAWLALIGTTGRLFSQLDEELRATHDLTADDYGILAQLSEAPGGARRMTELARSRLISKSGLTHRIGILERAGLVLRRSCPTDKRGAEAVLTTMGRRLVERAAPDHVESVRAHLFDQLTKSEVEVLARALGKVDARLHEIQDG